MRNAVIHADGVDLNAVIEQPIDGFVERMIAAVGCVRRRPQARFCAGRALRVARSSAAVKIAS